MSNVYVSIGSNIEPLRYIQAGLAEMRQQFDTLTLSSVYESEAVGFEGENFYNLVAGFDTQQEIHTVAHILRCIEDNNGRKRTSNRFSARTLDLDVLLYDNLIFKDDEITVPRDEIMKYAFVLLPLAEIAPSIKHPVTGQHLTDLAQSIDIKEQSIWRIELDIVL